jgi:hypothetical protein
VPRHNELGDERLRIINLAIIDPLLDRCAGEVGSAPKAAADPADFQQSVAEHSRAAIVPRDLQPPYEIVDFIIVDLAHALGIDLRSAEEIIRPLTGLVGIGVGRCRAQQGRAVPGQEANGLLDRVDRVGLAAIGDQQSRSHELDDPAQLARTLKLAKGFIKRRQSLLRRCRIGEGLGDRRQDRLLARSGKFFRGGKIARFGPRRLRNVQPFIDFTGRWNGPDRRGDEQHCGDYRVNGKHTG